MMSCVLTKKKKISRSSCKSGQRERLSFRSIWTRSLILLTRHAQRYLESQKYSRLEHKSTQKRRHLWGLSLVKWCRHPQVKIKRRRNNLKRLLQKRKERKRRNQSNMLTCRSQTPTPTHWILFVRLRKTCRKTYSPCMLLVTKATRVFFHPLSKRCFGPPKLLERWQLWSNLRSSTKTLLTMRWPPAPSSRRDLSGVKKWIHYLKR